MASSIESLDFSNIIYQTIKNASLFYSTSPKLTYFLGFGFIFFIYYYQKVVNLPILYSGNKRFKDFLIQNCGQIIEKPVYPTWYAFNTHAQTVLANIVRGTLPRLQYKREVIQMSDGGEVSLDWYKDDETPKNAPICIFIPGLTGDSSTEYIISLIPVSHSVGIRCCVLNNRGRGNMKLKTPRLYCASNCEDCEAVLNHVKAKNPDSKIIAVGISLGGIVLGRYLTQKGEKAVVDAAMLISVCYDFFSGCNSLENNRLNLALNRHLSRTLKAIINTNLEVLKLNDKNVDFNEVMKCETLKEFDQAFTCKMWGYDTVDDYYRDASLKDKLHLIKKPTLCVNASDDIFQPLETLPIDEFKKSSHLALLITSHGGHIGFMDNFYPPFFTDRLCKEYLSALKNLNDIKEAIG